MRDLNKMNVITGLTEPSMDELKQLLELFTRGNHEETEKLANSLIESYPTHGFAWKVLGSVLQKLDKLDQSLIAKRKAVELMPQDAEVYNNLANALFQIDELIDAESYCRKALVLDSQLINAHLQLGLILQKMKRHQEAEESFRHVLAINPKSAEGYFHLGSTLQEKRLLSQAASNYEKALTINPKYVDALYNLGAIFKEQEKYAEAEICYRKVMDIAPNFANIISNLATILEVQGRYPEAIEHYRHVLATAPDNANIYCNLAGALNQVKRFTEAKEAYQSALLSAPRHGYALGQYINIRRFLCDWKAIDEDVQKLLLLIETHESTGIMPFILLAIPKLHALHHKKTAKSYANFRYQQKLDTNDYAHGAMYQHTKLRIGYLSADIHSHATACLMAGVWENRNTHTTATYIYSYGNDHVDAYRIRIENACEYFRPVYDMSDEAIAAQILADEIDILVDLKGYTTAARLEITALRPAPVIVSWLGYPGTLGHERLADYIIGDPTVTPPEHAVHFSETLALMPHCYQPNDNKRPIGVALTRKEVGLPENAFVFCTFNQAYKITSDMFDIWCRLLIAVPHSVLWLLECHVVTQENLRREMEERGVDATRIIFAPKMQQTPHLGRLQLADLAVDTFPYTSHTTASDALWAGVPLVTKMGETFASRVAASILNTMDLAELVTTNDKDYFNIALSLAQNPEKLANIKQKIAEQKQISPLFDTQKFARDLERLYQTIWKQELVGRRQLVDLSAKNNTNLNNRYEVANKKPSCNKAEGLNPSLADQQKLLDLYDKHLFSDAVEMAQMLVVHFPNSGFLWKALGSSLQQSGLLEESIMAKRKSVELLPNDVDALSNLANALMEANLLEDAEVCFRHVIALDPSLMQAYNELGLILIKLDRPHEAEAVLSDMLKMDSEYLQAYDNLGKLFLQQQRYPEAKLLFLKALTYLPYDTSLMSSLIISKRNLCDWEGTNDQEIQLITHLEQKEFSPFIPFILCACSSITVSGLYHATKTYSDFTYSIKFPNTKNNPIESCHPRLRIGYLSADFHSHATVYLMAGILENRNKAKFDVYLYSYGPDKKDGVRSRIENACEIFRNVRTLSDEQIAKNILTDEIDILIDLKGYTGGTRLGISALRPAPVIINWLGYPGTLGHEGLADYIVGDTTVTPLEHAEYYSETLALMPHCYQPNDNKRPIGVASTRTEVGLPENAFVFCTFNQAYKITPDMFDIWCRLLGTVPNSVLWLLEPHQTAQENLHREMEIRGIESSRLIFAPKMEQTAHLGRLQLADLAVDTFPYTSHTTASDALWAGVPLVTKMGETFASRVAASILNTIDLSELVTTNDEDYFNVALSLAQNPEKLAAIKQKIAEQKQISPLFDTQKFARDLERLYQTIWKQELRGERKTVVLTDKSQKEIIMNETLAEILKLECLTEIVDIGANPIDGDPPYKPMLSKALCNITGFEPQELALAELLKKKSEFERYLPYAVGDGNVHTLNICRASGMTSLFEPDATTLELFDILKPLAEVTQRIELQTRKLDEIIEIEKLDFLKIDIQGGELLVFKNGVNKLANAVAIQVEVSFVTLYKNQPTMGEIDIELRRQGFIPHCFAAVKNWAISPCVVNNNPRQPLNQLLEADIVYVRDFSKPELMTDEQLKHLAMIAHYCYGSYDLALRCIMLLEQRNTLPSGSQQNYLDLLGRKV